MLSAKRFQGSLEKVATELKGLSSKITVYLNEEDVNSLSLDDVRNYKEIKSNFESDLHADLIKIKKLAEKKKVNEDGSDAFEYNDKFRDLVMTLEMEYARLKQQLDRYERDINEFEIEENERVKMFAEQQRIDEETRRQEKIRSDREKIKMEKALNEKEEAERKQREMEALEKRKAELVMQAKEDQVLERRFDELQKKAKELRSKIDIIGFDKALNSVIAKLTSKGDSRKQKDVLNLLRTFFENITRRPEEEKFRKFNIENPKFRDEVLSFDGTFDLFIVAGFELKFEHNFDDVSSTKIVYLLMKEPDINQFEEWKIWFDKQKLILEKFNNII